MTVSPDLLLAMIGMTINDQRSRSHDDYSAHQFPASHVESCLVVAIHLSGVRDASTQLVGGVMDMRGVFGSVFGMVSWLAHLF